MAQIAKDLAAFRCRAALTYIETLNLNDNQIDTLFKTIADEVTARSRESA
jgi:hypothetical protein